MPPLLLSDFAQPANTDLICGALLVASDTTNYYADSDRAGTDTPLDGELGLGATETVISRIRRVAASQLILNDNDSPVALAIGDYFTVGEGLDATIHVQTEDGVESFLVDGAVDGSGGNFVRFNIPSALSTLLNGIAVDDRFIFAITAPVVSAFTGDAEPIGWSFGVSQATGSTVAPHFTGDAEPITWSFGTSNATGSTVPPHFTGNAEPATWSFMVSQATGTATIPGVSGNAEPITWSFEVLRATGSATIPGVSGQALPIAWSFGVSPATGSSVPPAFTGTALSIDWSFGASQATGSTVEPTPDLVLADFVQPANTDLICGALLVALDTVNYYADSDRGGTGTPLDGELGLGDDNTVISRVRRHAALALTLNNNDNPVALDMGVYFSTGDGANATVHVQTLDGVQSVAVSGITLLIQNAGTARFPISSDFDTLLQGIAIGDRFILAITTPVVQAFNGQASPINWSFGVSQATGTTVPPNFTGNAEPVAWSFGVAGDRHDRPATLYG